MAWTTRLDPALIRRFGSTDLHLACFEPPDWPGRGMTFNLLIPECEFQCAFPDSQGNPVGMINRPTNNRNVKSWTKFACREADRAGAFLQLACDTEEQLETAVRQVGRLLPRYHRVTLERMYEPQNRSRSNLS
jgi:hypothetical protein